MVDMRSVLDALAAGLLVLLPQFAVTMALLIIGVAIYMRLTPFNERNLVVRPRRLVPKRLDQAAHQPIELW